MLPVPSGARAPHTVARIREGSKVGCEIVGPRRTTRWLFDGDQGLASVKVVREQDPESGRMPRQ
jgi:hypothetical protein